MSVYNESPQWLHESIASILNQTHRYLEFIIIIDNPQNSILIDIIASYAKEDVRLQYYVNDENKGLVYSLNRALRYTKGDYIARMDADDISHASRLEKQLLFLENNHLDLIGSNVTLFTGEKEIFFVTNKLRTHTYLYKILARGIMGIVHPTFFARAEVFSMLGGYNNAYHAEDQDLLARAFCHGFKMGNTAEVLLDCRYSNDSVTKTNAIYVTKMSAYITKVFQGCIQKKSHSYTASYDAIFTVSQKEKDAFNRKKIYIDEARKAWHAKQYCRALWKVLHSIVSSRSTWKNIQTHLWLRWYVWKENRVFEDSKDVLL